jgi:hypothetical protein
MLRSGILALAFSPSQQWDLDVGYCNRTGQEPNTNIGLVAGNYILQGIIADCLRLPASSVWSVRFPSIGCIVTGSHNGCTESMYDFVPR